MTLLEEISSYSILEQAWEHIKKKKDVTPGIDAETVTSFSRNLETNLNSLSTELKTKTFSFTAVLETDIPKGDNKGVRSIRIFTIRDKIVQKAIQIILEKKRKPHSFFPEIRNKISIGFLTKVSAKEYLGVKKAVDEVKKNYSKGYQIMSTADIVDFFDKIDKKQLIKDITSRLPDDTINWLIPQLLNPKILKKDRYDSALIDIQTTESGVGQGSIISPLLSNIYLINFDKEIEKTKIPSLRYADDFAFFSKNTEDAKKNLIIIRDILKKTSGLDFHPDKSKKEPAHYLLRRFACFLGIRFEKKLANRWEISPIPSKTKEMEQKIINFLDSKSELVLIERINKINMSLTGWIGGYKYVGCTKKVLKNIYLKLQNTYEEKLNILLKKKGIINRELTKKQLEFLGVGKIKINNKKNRKK